MNQRLKAIEDWVEYIKTHEDWKKHHTKFINSQFELANKAIIKISKMPNGSEKLMELYNIKNKKGYPKLIK